MILSRRAQTIMEYTMLIAIVAMAVVVMTPRVKRMTQSLIKSGADQIGDQEGAEQTFNDAKSGYMNSSVSTSVTLLDNTRRETAVNGVAAITQTFNETTTTNTAEFSYGGWSQ
jgi:uncharacterized protein (UPF0333 family)